MDKSQTIKIGDIQLEVEYYYEPESAGSDDGLTPGTHEYFEIEKVFYKNIDVWDLICELGAENKIMLIIEEKHS